MSESVIQKLNILAGEMLSGNLIVAENLAHIFASLPAKSKPQDDYAQGVVTGGYPVLIRCVIPYGTGKEGAQDVASFNRVIVPYVRSMIEKIHVGSGDVTQFVVTAERRHSPGVYFLDLAAHSVPGYELRLLIRPERYDLSPEYLRKEGLNEF